MLNIVNNNEFLKSEFIDQAKLLDVKLYSEDAVLGLINVQRGLIEKAEKAELTEEESEQLDVCKAELQSIEKVVLVNDELAKENWFVRTGQGADIEKSKKAGVGEIHTWNGKRYRKEANGKWVEVSEHGMSKKEHEDKAGEHRSNMETSNKKGEGHIYYREMAKRDEHKDVAGKLSDKEHTDEEVGLGKKEEPKKGDKIEHNGVTIHVGHDKSGGQDTLTYTAPSISDKKYWDLSSLKKEIDSKSKK